MYDLFRNLQQDGNTQDATLAARQSAHQSEMARNSVYDCGKRLPTAFSSFFVPCWLLGSVRAN